MGLAILQWCGAVARRMIMAEQCASIVSSQTVAATGVRCFRTSRWYVMRSQATGKKKPRKKTSFLYKQHMANQGAGGEKDKK